jgi:hypothetical protein
VKDAPPARAPHRIARRTLRRLVERRRAWIAERPAFDRFHPIEAMPAKRRVETMGADPAPPN